MKAEMERLGQELAEVRAQSRGRALRYPKALREAVVEAAREGLEAGGALSAVARRLGIAPGTLDRWLATGPEPRFRPVEVVTPSRADGSTITLVTPKGFRFEGLDPAQAVELLARLDARQ